MSVPFIDLKRFEPNFLEELNENLIQLFKNSQFIGGEEVEKLESSLEGHLGVTHAITCANGTDALQLALRALGVKPNDIVLVPNFTFWATFEAIVNVGAHPVTIDADISDAGVDINAFSEAISQLKPKAAIVAHLFGWASSKLVSLRKLCADNNVSLLEDGAQCFGTMYKKESIYKNALISTTSFYPAKVLGGAGDGGAVFTNDAELADKVKQLANHGRTSHYGYGSVGWNSRLDSIQAAFLNLSLKHIQSRINSRRASTKLYQDKLPKLGIQVMLPPPDFEENGYCNVCIVNDAEKKTYLESILKSKNIGYANIYPGVMSEQTGALPYLKNHIGGNAGKNLSCTVLNLPLFAYMKENELDEIINVIERSLHNDQQWTY
ncbi:dTDP-4-amino-4,6-dideoxygalactose transaminase [Thiothrix eikelboomii]|uniref:dTDP-4-amino-4,6-dideoxygalactose transaminase n=1 Tax=Thiothrix eikelboomii TaxID=92487 RepID=A0A1T4XIU3_9GAMM|nr:DegT/DnrJ/EryC1/StrS family aminotransferase [Thiothrix eikelboomii]SKA89444.1 dTDP-4-amino-4,6-dideoxygalactose transaminase [Thiothrix eikelboomii]